MLDLSTVPTSTDAELQAFLDTTDELWMLNRGTPEEALRQAVLDERFRRFRRDHPRLYDYPGSYSRDTPTPF